MTQDRQGQPLDSALGALERYAPGDEPGVLTPIERAVHAVHGDPARRTALEQRLLPLLSGRSPRESRAFVCRQLAVIGSAASVPALAPLLVDEHLSHMARYALEQIPGPEADKALRDAAGKATGHARIGIVQSIGVRRDARAAPLLAKMLSDESDVASAAAKALGEIGTVDAAKILDASRATASGALRLALADASLICAERLVATGQREQARALVQPLTTTSYAPHVRVAANRALSAAMRP